MQAGACETFRLLISVRKDYGMSSIRNDITRILCWKRISPRPGFEVAGVKAGSVGRSR